MSEPVHGIEVYENALKYLDYDPATGIVKWAVKRKGILKGGLAGTIIASGYRIVSVDGVKISLHRIAWYAVHGYVSENEIDHINQDPLDNRIENLREVSHQCNAVNKKLCTTNTSGVTGVSERKQTGSWRAHIKINRKFKHIGFFEKYENAVIARAKAEVEYNFLDCQTKSSAWKYIKENNLDVWETSPERILPNIKNTSGVTGVTLSSQSNKWISRITKEGKRLPLGCFKDFADAVIARAKAELELLGVKKSSAWAYIEEHGIEVN